jgi:hypothetical protein
MSLVGLPTSPDHPLYAEMLADIESVGATDPQRAMLLMAAACEEDFWLFCKMMTSLGSFRNGDRGHPLRGQLWLHHPWLFERFREIQYVLEERVHSYWFRWFRASLKTTGILKCGSLWLLARDRNERIGAFTHKLEQVGESMGDDMLGEIRKNPRLADHWPQFRKLEEASTTRITLDRPPGPKEPSFSLHPILGSATSGHFTFIFVDDAVTDKIIESVAETKKVDRQLDRLFPLRADDTPIVYLGTIWGENDPMLARERAGRFFFISTQPAQLPDGTWQLRSERFFLEQKRGMGSFEWNAQYLLKIVPRGDRYFEDGWKTYYTTTPQVCANDHKRIHMIVDTGGGEKHSDFDVVRVIGIAHDRRRYNLDLWRERVGIAKMCDLLFGEENNVRTTWLRHPLDTGDKGLVGYWRRFDPLLVLWVEQFGENLVYQTLKMEIQRRGVSVTLRKLPAIKRKKPTRIRALQIPYRDGKILYPNQGFGHHSKEDKRDTADQFWQEEYSLWTLDEDQVLNDDLLDTDAWHSQPETISLMAYPRTDPTPQPVYDPHDPANFGRPGEVSYSQASGWVQ